MREIKLKLPVVKLKQIETIASKYECIDRSPMAEICLRSVYWGGTWGLLIQDCQLQGRKKDFSVSVPDPVANNWFAWLAQYEISSTFAGLYLCCAVVLPPLPIDWQLGSIAATTWYRDRSTLVLAENFRPKRKRSALNK